MPKEYPYPYPPFLPADHPYYQTRDFLEQKLMHREARLGRLLRMSEFKVVDETVPAPKDWDSFFQQPNSELKTQQAKNIEAGIIPMIIESELELIESAKQQIKEWDEKNGGLHDRS